jgi:hypothetical protein
MNALFLALSLSLARAEGTFDGPVTLSAELPFVAPRVVLLEPAPFPLEMSYFNVEAPVEDPRGDLLDLRLAGAVTLRADVEMPSYADLMDMGHSASPIEFDAPSPRPWLVAAPAKAPVTAIPWLKDFNQR